MNAELFAAVDAARLTFKALIDRPAQLGCQLAEVEARQAARKAEQAPAPAAAAAEPAPAAAEAEAPAAAEAAPLTMPAVAGSWTGGLGVRLSQPPAKRTRSKARRQLLSQLQPLTAQDGF